MSDFKKGVLYLIPSGLKENVNRTIMSGYNIDIINSLNEFIVEAERTARRFLKAIDYKQPFDSIIYHILDEHTDSSEYSAFLNSVKEGKDIGLLSEAGCPCIADPGAEIVRIAHENNIKVVPLIGPSSILLSLMASGFNGQNFAFNGYLPIDKRDRSVILKQIEADIFKKNQTQIFIETPYRNKQLLQDIVSTCHESVMLCIAIDLTLPTESIVSKPVKYWKKANPDINKKPAVFLLFK